MRILAAGCFHGNIPKNLKRFCKKNKIDAIVFAGDFGDDRFQRKFEFKHDKEIIERLLHGEEWKNIFNEIVGDKKKYQILAKKDLEVGKRTIQKAKNLGMKFYFVHGNHDYEYYNLFHKTKNFIFIHRKMVRLDGLTLAGYGGYRGMTGKYYLWGWKASKKFERYVNESKNIMRKRLKRLFSKKVDILLTHDPPYNTKLDYLFSPGQLVHKKHIGDDIIREFIEKYKPKLHICAHMHERRGIDKIGKTIILNPGFGQRGEAAIVDLPEVKIKFVKID